MYSRVYSTFSPSVSTLIFYVRFNVATMTPARLDQSSIRRPKPHSLPYHEYQQSMRPLITILYLLTWEKAFVTAFRPGSWISRQPNRPPSSIGPVGILTPRSSCRPQLLVQQSSSASTDVASSLPRLSSEHLKELTDKKYVVIPNFLSPQLQDELRADVQQLRLKNKFQVAKIGQDATNTLNRNIRQAETCFIGSGKLADAPNEAREKLYSILDTVRQDLSITTKKPLDSSLTELLYAFYPEGGFYRRHRDAIRDSASVLRTYSLLLYLNKKDWSKADGGQLRMHFDSGGDELPPNEFPNYIDVLPQGGTLVLFESDAIPHEVLDTQKERMAVVGWYNRPVGLGDIQDLSSAAGSSLIQKAMLVLSAALVMLGFALLLDV